MPRSRRLARIAVCVALVTTVAVPSMAGVSLAASPATGASHVTRLSGSATHGVHHQHVDARAAALQRGSTRTASATIASHRTSSKPLAASGPSVAALAAPTLATFSATTGVKSVGFGGSTSGTLCDTVPCLQRADSSVAVGPFDVVQTTSVGFDISDLSGDISYQQTYGDFAGLNPATQGGAEGRVIYDSAHKRWIAAYATWTCNGVNTNAGSLSVAISDSTDPQWFWDIWNFPLGQFVPVTPSIGTSSATIAIGVGRSAIPSLGTACFDFSTNVSSTEASVLVIDWASILTTPASLPGFLAGFEASAEPWVMARTEGGPASATDFGIDRGGGLTRLLRVTGSVSSSVSLTVTDLTGGGILDLDGKALSVARDGANLAISSDTTCTPAGAVTLFGCARVTRMASSGSALVEDLAIGTDGFDVGAASVAIAGDGTLHVVYNAVEQGTGDVSSWTAHRATGAPAGEFSEPALIAAGANAYTGHSVGGMVGIAPDANDTHAVWQAYEFGGDSGGGWTTWISKLSTGVAASPAGSVSIEAGRPTTHALAVHLSAVATSGTQLLVSNSPTMSAGKLSAAAVSQPTGDLRWDLSDATFGGSSATGTRHVYIQFGDGAGTWSSVVDSTITYAGPPPVIRRSGATRYDTAAAVAINEYKPHVHVVYIATGLNFPDALAGAGAAGFKGGPILLVTSTAIPPATASALTFLKPDKIIVLGGTGAVSDSVRLALGAYTPGGAADVTRISGASRYATAAAISAATYAPGVEEVLIATGANFPDALAGAAVAGRLGDPLLLVTASTIPAPTAAELTRLKPHRITILGGTGVVSSTVAAALFSYTDGGVFRVAGANRYETAAFIADSYFVPQPTLTLVATGLNFPDALAGAALAGRLSSPILLVAPTSIPAATDGELRILEPPEIDVLGGTGAVSAGVATSLNGYIVP
jgi:putative cell wall-binding protein